MFNYISLLAGKFLRGQPAARLGLMVYALIMHLLVASCYLFGHSRGLDSSVP